MPRPGFALTLALLLLLVAPVAAEDPVPTKEDLERNLVLRIVYAGPPTVQPGEAIPMTWSLHNRSETTTYRFVMPGDGSEVGWREPYVYYTGQRPDEDGTWQDVEPRSAGGRCGLFDANWHDEVRSIAPGETVSLDTWLPPPDYAIDLQGAGPVRLRGHYAYRAQEPEQASLEPQAPARGFGRMGSTPPFHLVSNPIELRIVRRLEIEATIVGEVRRGQEQRLSELLALRVVNATDEPIVLDPQQWDFEMGHVAGLRVEMNRHLQPTWPVLEAAEPRRLLPGASVPLVGPDALRPGRDMLLRFEGEPEGSAWARFVLVEGGGGRVRLATPYLELKIAR